MKKLIMILLLFTGVVMASENKFVISSSDFIDKGTIPAKFSYKQENISPSLAWSGAPTQTKSFALVIIDYDAKAVVGHSVVHWVLYNIPKDVQNLVVGDNRFAEGLNSYNIPGFRGMNPPQGQRHNYHFYLYALNVDKLEFASPPTGEDFLEKIKNNIIDTAEMVAGFEQ